MRRLANFESSERAELLNDVLYGRGIQAEVRDGADGAAVWVLDESKLQEARNVLSDFVSEAGQTRFEADAQAARAERKAAEKREQRSRHKVVQVRETYHQGPPRGTVTVSMLIVCLGLALITYLKESTQLESYLTIVPYVIEGGYVRYPSLSSLLYTHQWWRLVTPIFLHGGALHLLFNMWWLMDLGASVERVQGSARFVLFVVVVGALSNVAQLWMDGPHFRGMSGVVYGLAGYLWARGRFDPASPVGLPSSTMTFLTVWMLLGFTPVLDRFVRMANYCHLGGLVVGAAWAYLGVSYRRWRRP